MKNDPRILLLFKQLGANHPMLKEYLTKERESAVQYMAQSGDPTVIYRAQGRLALAEEMLKMLV
jgi:hypothetical protein